MTYDVARVLANDHVRRVLVYRLGSLGDTLIALPSFHLIARAFPSRRAPPPHQPPCRRQGPARRRRARAHRPHPRLHALHHRHPLHPRAPPPRPRDPPLLALTSSSTSPAPAASTAARRDAKFFRLAGVTRQIGVPLTTAAQLNLFGGEAPASPDADLEPEASRLARNIRELGDARLDDPASWDLHLTPDEHATAARAIGPEALQHETPRRQRRHQSSIQGLGPRQLARAPHPPRPRLPQPRPPARRLAPKSPTPPTSPPPTGSPPAEAPSSTSAAASRRANPPLPSPAPASSSATTAAPCTSPPPSAPPASPSSPRATSRASGSPTARPPHPLPPRRVRRLRPRDLHRATKEMHPLHHPRRSPRRHPLRHERRRASNHVVTSPIANRALSK